MADRNLSGISGVEINAGDHICALYTRRGERDDVLMPFLREGLDLGHKCLVGLYEQDTRSIPDALGPTWMLSRPSREGSWRSSVLRI